MATQKFQTLPVGTARTHPHMAGPILDANNVVVGFTASGGDTYPLATYATDLLTGGVAGLSNPAGGLIPLVTQQPVLAAVGDSRIALGRTASASSGYELRTDGATNWIEPLMQGRVRHPASHYLAVSGSGYADANGVLTLQIPQLAALSPRPTHVAILSGTNDIGNAVPLATIKANILLAWAQIRSLGMIPVQILDLPRTVASWTANMAKQRLDLNNWIAANAPLSGAYYIDGNQSYVDPANANGDPLTGYNMPDGIHPTSKGAYQVGLALKKYFDTIALPNIVRPSSQLDVYDATLNPRGNGILLGGTMSGSTGTNSGVGASGTVASNFQNRVLTGTATAVSTSGVARTDGGAGYWDQVVIAATTLSTFRFTHTGTAANATVGDMVYGAVDLVITCASLDFLSLLVLTNGGTGNSSAFKTTSTFPMPDMTIVAIRLITPPFVLGAGTTDILFRIDSQIEAGGSATILIGGAEIRKVIAGTA